MSPPRVSSGSLSQTWAVPPRPPLDAPLLVERTHEHLEEAFLLHAEEEARTLATLPAPFRRVLEVRRVGRVLELTQERFLGVSGRQLRESLARGGRLLPLDVWLALADALCRAWALVPAGGPVWRLPFSIDCFGVDLRRRFLVFPEPDHSIVAAHSWGPGSTQPMPRRWENDSPEHATTGPMTERARVCSLTTVLVELLTLERPFRRSTDLATLQAVMTGEPRWTPASHPHCGAALGEVLSGAMRRDPAQRPESLDALRRLLLDAAGCAPASTDRVGNVVLGVDPEPLRRSLATLKAQPDFLPESWRQGGLDVLEDSLLEGLGPLEHLPLSQAKLPTAGPPPAPRVNLAPARRPWWQALWPFGRP